MQLVALCFISPKHKFLNNQKYIKAANIQAPKKSPTVAITGGQL